MFANNREIVSVPNVSLAPMDDEHNTLPELISTKRKLITIFKYITRIPYMNELLQYNTVNIRELRIRADYRDNIGASINDCITNVINQLNIVNESIANIKHHLLYHSRTFAYKYQINLMRNIFTNGECFHLNLDNIAAIPYNNGHIQFNESYMNEQSMTHSSSSDDDSDNENDNDPQLVRIPNRNRIRRNSNSHAHTITNDDARIIDIANIVFDSPHELNGLIDNEQIKSISRKVYEFIEKSEPLIYMQVSEFQRECYLKCISALVICVPYHDMKLIPRFFMHFEDVDYAVDHVLTLFNVTFRNESFVTTDEWLFDSTGGNNVSNNVLNNGVNSDINNDRLLPIMQFSNTTIDVDSSEIRARVLYPQHRNENENEMSNANVSAVCANVGKYNVRMMMKDIFSTIAALYIKCMQQ